MPRPSSNTARTRLACIVLWVRNIAPPSPAETLQGGANSRTKPRRLDAREVLVTAGQMSCFFFFCASSVIEPHGYCRSHNHTATRSAMLQSIMPSTRLARYRQRRYAKHCSAVSRGDLARRSKFPYESALCSHHPYQTSYRVSLCTRYFSFTFCCAVSSGAHASVLIG